MMHPNYKIKKKSDDQLVGVSFVLDDMTWDFQISSFYIANKKYHYSDVQHIEFQHAMIMNTKIFTLTFVFNNNHQHIMKLNLCQQMTLHFKTHKPVYVAKHPHAHILYAIMDFLLKRVQSTQPNATIMIGHSQLYKAGVFLFALILPSIILILPQVNLFSLEEWKMLLAISMGVYLSYSYMNLKPKTLKVSHFNIYEYALNTHSS